MLIVDRNEVNCLGVESEQLLLKLCEVSQAEEGRDLDRGSHARRLPLQTGRTPTFLNGPQHAVLGVHPPPPPGSDIHVLPCPCCPCCCPALRPACQQLPAASHA